MLSPSWALLQLTWVSSQTLTHSPWLPPWARPFPWFSTSGFLSPSTIVMWGQIIVGCVLWDVIYPLDAGSILLIVTTKSAASTAHFPLRDKATTPWGTIALCGGGRSMAAWAGLGETCSALG